MNFSCIIGYYNKNLINNLLPMMAPKHKYPKSQPERDREETPLKKAPILQPKAIFEPYPINKPPIIAAITCL